MKKYQYHNARYVQNRQYHCSKCAQNLTMSVDGGTIYDQKWTCFVDGAGRTICNVCRNEVDRV